MYPKAIEPYFAPTTVDAAFRLLAEHRDSATLLAGGQSLMPTLKLRLVEPGCLIDLNRIPVLWPMRATDDSDWRLAGVCAAGGGASGRHRLGRRRLRAGGRDGRRRSRMANCICSCLSVWKRASRWRAGHHPVSASPATARNTVLRGFRNRARFLLHRGHVIRSRIGVPSGRVFSDCLHLGVT
jgi:FAD binding domain in molybdopterin dehydrogenase